MHWVAVETRDGPTLNSVVAGVNAWSKRKRDTFRTNHIAKAWDRLREHSLLEVPTT